MLKLKDFITESLTQIVEGIREAQKQTAETGALINPVVGVSSEGRIAYVDDRHNQFAQRVEFDVAVGATEERKAAGKVGVLWVVAGGVEGEKTSGTETASRIRFGVYVAFPTSAAR